MSDPKRVLAELAIMVSKKPEVATTLISVAKAITAVEYGEITIKMQAVKPVRVDSVKRERVGWMAIVGGLLLGLALGIPEVAVVAAIGLGLYVLWGVLDWRPR